MHITELAFHESHNSSSIELRLGRLTSVPRELTHCSFFFPCRTFNSYHSSSLMMLLCLLMYASVSYSKPPPPPPWPLPPPPSPLPPPPSPYFTDVYNSTCLKSSLRWYCNSSTRCDRSARICERSFISTKPKKPQLQLCPYTNGYRTDVLFNLCP